MLAEVTTLAGNWSRSSPGSTTAASSPTNISYGQADLGRADLITGVGGQSWETQSRARADA
ncbi:MAG TPA: hypothetical protein VGH53_16345 [Streptosporangiaceae bacterium]